MHKADLVLEGGVVKGFGLVGAVLRLMRDGYRFQRVAGTSAGAILAALLAAGMTERQLSSAIKRLDFARVPDRPSPGIPVVSEGISLIARSGAYDGDYIRDFVHAELERLGVTTFGDLRDKDRGADSNLADDRRYKLVVMSTDVTKGRLLRLPWDYRLLNLEPDEQLVADAVRASLSVPLFFKPVYLRDGKTGERTTLVDGGVLSNFPIEIFDRTDDARSRWPTLGVKVFPSLPAGDAQLLPRVALPQLPPVRLLQQVVATAIFGHDQTYLERPCVKRRTIQVDTSALGVIDFDLSPKQRAAAIAKGDAAATEFLRAWSWDDYRHDCLPVSQRA